ncbi:MAG: hypothetical protein GY710_08355 [Desulfobacteraceae bacterium]|nr:hypothetical protein [Desulfobacteraceae bacterium]
MFFLKNTLGKYKLPVGFLLIILLFLSFGIITTRGLVTLHKLTRTIYNHPLVVSNASLLAALNITKMHRTMKDVVLADSPQEVKIALEIVSKNEQEVYRQLDIIRKKILGEQGQFLEEQTRQLFKNWKPIRQKVTRLLGTGRKKEAISVTMTKGADHVLKLETKMLELTSYARIKADHFVNLAQNSQSKLEKFTIILTILGVFLSLVIAFATIYFAATAKKVIQNEKAKLQKALDEINTLHGIIPICSHCKQIRDDKGLWTRVEEYIQTHSEAKFSHGICPDCVKTHYPKFYQKKLSQQKKENNGN